MEFIAHHLSHINVEFGCSSRSSVPNARQSHDMLMQCQGQGIQFVNLQNTGLRIWPYTDKVETLCDRVNLKYG